MVAKSTHTVSATHTHTHTVMDNGFTCSAFRFYVRMNILAALLRHVQAHVSVSVSVILYVCVCVFIICIWVSLSVQACNKRVRAAAVKLTHKLSHTDTHWKKHTHTHAARNSQELVVMALETRSSCFWPASFFFSVSQLSRL